MNGMTDRGLRVIELRAQNIKRLKAVRVHPTGALVAVQGDNGEGKSSLLDAMVYALCGARTHPAEPVRRGTTGAQVVVDLGELVVERTWRGEETELVVRGKEGGKLKSPQKILDDLVGKLAFDPTAFLRMEPREQSATLRQLAGLDTRAIDERRAALAEQRLGLTRQRDQLSARLLALPNPPASEEDIDVAVLHARLETLQREEAAAASVRQEADEAERREAVAHTTLAGARERVERLKAELASAEGALHAAFTAATAASDAAAPFRAALQALPSRAAEIEATHGAIRAALGQQEEAQQRRIFRETQEQFRGIAEELEGTQTLIAEADAERQALLEAARFPVEGLGVTDEGVTFRDLPLEQAAASEALKVSTAIGLALNPHLRVLFVRDGSLLDESSVAMVAEMAAAADAQVWIEVVGDRGLPGVVIEDGEVARAIDATPETRKGVTAA